MPTSTTPSVPLLHPQRHFQCKPIQLDNFSPTSFYTPATRRPNWPRMEITSSRHRREPIVIMGATGSGKSRLSVDLAPLFDSEIINSDTISDITPEFYEPDADNRTALRKAIGVPDLDRCFKQYPPVGPMQNKGHNWPHMQISSSSHHRKEKVIVLMGATGSGKSRLSIDLATLFHSEIINSDKIKVYKGLDITTDKIPVHQRNNIPHHLLGDVDPSHGEFSPSDFRRHAGDIISDITYRKKFPIIVGGSNSFIHALLVERFDSQLNVFENESSLAEISSDLRYKCCFIWMDISLPVLSEYLRKRVDDMFDSGMTNELAEFYEPDADNRTGLRKAIGVPEFDRFFKQYPPAEPIKNEVGNSAREGAYEEAVKAIKDNTCQLAKRQKAKILRLKRAGWDLRRIDVTEAVRAMLTSESNGGGKGFSDVWKKQVLELSVKIVKRFLME